ncbi:hypothetical protein BIW11_03142 [Tropilaelaps mercedesae]|uniref:Uncharacterized protein n=1 Tax=Tropilaelaps mercedesae TaxID=418985 RepID=A0A1V9XRP8_9ACAR|nr:hypothetical protein BIW11_03142 [Tropilaelaps mercedesae]
MLSDIIISRASGRIIKVVQNNKNSRLRLYSLESDGSLKHRATFERKANLTDFAICSDGSRCVVSFFNGFGDPPKFNACDTIDWKKVEDFYKPAPRMLFSPREMAFDSDVITIMRNQTVFICDRQDGSVGEFELPNKLDRSSFVNFIRLGNKVYVYEDRTYGGIGDYLCDDR